MHTSLIEPLPRRGQVGVGQQGARGASIERRERQKTPKARGGFWVGSFLVLALLLAVLGLLGLLGRHRLGELLMFDVVAVVSATVLSRLSRRAA